ncbi:MAG: hypothetical protein DID92_2727743539 [Candidatus Nitrotoga sp. SPKER]|nr:MAG: hypothetical protein DID92_2727743539 [Candidatus Nitrotoga sp. SPKER]
MTTSIALWLPPVIGIRAISIVGNHLIAAHQPKFGLALTIPPIPLSDELHSITLK